MLKVNQLLQQIASQQQGLTIKVDPGNRLEAVFPNGRRQRMIIERQGERYILTSVVLTSKRVKEFWRSELLPHLWKRNRETNVVAFSLDRQDRLVGQIEQLAETVDVDELAFYIALLARECDRFEYALTGQDQE